MPIFFNPETGTFVPIYDDAAEQLGFQRTHVGTDAHMPFRVGPADVRNEFPEDYNSWPAPGEGVTLESTGSPTRDEELGVVPTPETVARPAVEPEPQPTDPFTVDQSFGPGASTLEAPQAPVHPTPSVPAAPAGSSSTGGGYRMKFNPKSPPASPDYSGPLSSYADSSVEMATALGRAEGAIEANATERGTTVESQNEYAELATSMREGLSRARASAQREAENKIRAAVEAVPQADPGRVFKNMSGFTKGVLTIGAALNGFNVRFNRGRNGISEALTDIANRDMEAQKINIDTAREGVFRAERSYERQNAAWSQKLQDHDTGVLQRMSAFDRHLASLDANTQSEISKANIAQMRGQIGQRIAELSMNIMQKEDSRAVEVWKAGMQEVSANWRHAQSLKATADAKAGKGDGLNKRAIRSPVTGEIVGYHTIGTDNDVSDYNYKQANAKTAVDKLVEFRKLQKAVGSTITNWTQLAASPEKQRLARVYNEYITAKVKQRSGAAFTKEELNAYKDSMPIEKFWGPDNEATINDELEQVIEEQNSLNSAALEDGSGGRVQYDFREVLANAEARKGTGDNAPLPLGFSGLTKKLEASRTPKEFIQSARDIVAEANRIADTASGRVKIAQLKERLAQLPVEQRSLPSVNGDKDIVTILEDIHLKGQAEEARRERKNAATKVNRDAAKLPITHDFSYDND